MQQVVFITSPNSSLKKKTSLLQTSLNEKPLLNQKTHTHIYIPLHLWMTINCVTEEKEEKGIT